LARLRLAGSLEYGNSSNCESNFMVEFLQTLGAVVSFLLPVGIYCLYLAHVNRRPRPMMAGGAWDSLGLLFAASGFLVVTVPLLLTEFYRRAASVVDSIQALWLSYWIVWLAYYTALVVAAVWMIRARAGKTMIYNVDSELFPKALDQAFSQIGMEAHGDSNRLVLQPISHRGNNGSTSFMEAAPVAALPDRRHAEVEIEAFPALCHVTLHWRQCEAELRAEIERELDKALESAAPLENPAAGWFMSISGLVLGAVSAVVLALFFLVFFLGR
jgi:hypothetical protein